MRGYQPSHYDDSDSEKQIREREEEYDRRTGRRRSSTEDTILLVHSFQGGKVNNRRLRGAKDS